MRSSTSSAGVELRDINDGALLGYHNEGWGNVIDDGPVDRAWAKSRLDQCIALNRTGPCETAQSVFGLFREGHLNAFEPFILSREEAEVVWDYKFGPPRLLIFERVSYNRRAIKDFSALYMMLDLY